MKRLLLILIATVVFIKPLLAEHITGGEMYYTYKGIAPGGGYIYHITLKLYRDCFSAGAQLDPEAAIAIFSKAPGNAMVWHDAPFQRDSIVRLQLGTPGACITNAPVVCYEVGYYGKDIVLPASTYGYTVAYQRCCRINGISNLSGSGSQGATYTADIPGTQDLANAPENNSAKFVGTDTVIVCGGYPFTYSFAATDPDGDNLSYSFCQAYVGGGQGGGTGGVNTPAPDPPAAPPYTSVIYSFPYNSFAPLGLDVNIDPNTGLITGRAPDEGIYVVTVCVNEIRNGKIIATQRKDLQIKAGGCDIAKAQLDPQYITCDGFTMTFFNLSNSPLINSYFWQFGDPASGITDTSTNPRPTHTYSTAGDYTIKLVTNRNQECSDSTTAIVRVWPGFFPDFISSGVCLSNPVLFFDRTTTNYGVVDSWNWEFGDATTNADTSRIKNPQWNYADTGTKNVRFIVTNSKGCIDTIYKPVNVIAKPPINLPFRDTLICIPDDVQLHATGTGVFSWSPPINIVNANSAAPTVSPTTTTTYIVQLDQAGCTNTDSVTVRVVDHVTLSARVDTTSCQGDPVQLTVNSNGLQYEWFPTITLDNPYIKDPIATPTTTSTYTVMARIGSCTATENVTVFVVPYPFVNVAPDTTICYNTPAQLYGSYRGTSYSWTPANYLNNPRSINPIAIPPRTTTFVLAVYDTLGCPKPGYDSIVVTVLPKIHAFAGNDTLVVVGQPLQLNAEGGVAYVWTPPTGLNNPSIPNPVGNYDDNFDSIRYNVKVYNEAGCYDSAFVSVKVFKTNPYVFVPSAFTPNGDGLNDILRPIAVGVQEIKYFRIFNRWGQMIFSTTRNYHGWDGKISGTPQGSNVFVWMVEAIDYTGKSIFLKGTVTLVR